MKTAALLFATVVLNASAADMSDYSVTTGSVYQMSVSVCSKKQSALNVLDAEKISHDHANKLFDALDECDNIAASFRVGPIIAEAKTGGGLTSRVVEIQVPSDPKQKAYWLTRMQVVASVSKTGKPDNSVKQPVQIKKS